MLNNLKTLPSLCGQIIWPLAVGLVTGSVFGYLAFYNGHAIDPNKFPHVDVARLGDRHFGHGKNEEFHSEEDTAVADEMAKRIRVLCWIMTGPKNHEKKAKHVKATWGKRCNILLFMSSTNDSSLPSVGLPVADGRENLWAKTKESFKYVYKNYLHKADWFLKADDDTYVVVENLRHMLHPYSTEDPLYFGLRFKPFVTQGFMSGGAGYVLSRGALDRFVNRALPDPTVCSQSNGGAEDVEMGKCLAGVNVTAVDTRDSQKRGRFFPYLPEFHLIPAPKDENFWYWKYTYYESNLGMDCCSDNAVSFHYVPPNVMYVMDYLIYHLRPYGISNHDQLPARLPSNATVDTEPTNTTHNNSATKFRQ